MHILAFGEVRICCLDALLEEKLFENFNFFIIVKSLDDIVDVFLFDLWEEVLKNVFLEERWVRSNEIYQEIAAVLGIFANEFEAFKLFII